ncbi:ATP-dependent helicase [Mycoplasma bradburyae]|uniref:DNA 3'-5' helicase n=1 Tax=Mycoplasma bradburyae TaxID=2963128 RepID=A0AAW6HP78_9MOLU|nr:UvrD-helicase domain-containing protein [Mycoplasma bradburyae]MDC4183436.1 UvrD-helicase domain-containing protein [Mycoplasma bradburyae]
MKDYLQRLNKQQYDVVTSELIPIFVVAGAGTGKTNVLTSRIAYLIDHYNIPEYRLLAITFTNKAAKQMQHRLELLLQKPKVDVSFRTFHGLCAQIIREEVDHIDNLDNKFNILDEVDQGSVINEIYKSPKYDSYRDTYIDFKKSNILALINEAKIYNLNIPEFLSSDFNKLGEDHKIPNNLINCYNEFYEDYQQALVELNSIDFNDLLNITYNLFQNNRYVLKKWQKRFDCILVDEFQDTNEIQYNIIKLLREENDNFLFVGDPDQSIYGWRGASSEIGDSIQNDFSNLAIKYLTKNYRSKQSILNLANEAIKKNNSRYFKSLISHDLTDLGNKPIWINFANSEYQNRFVIDEIKKMISTKRYSYGDFAILYRTNFSSLSLERLIKENRIPYEIYGGYKFFLRKEIKDLVAYLKLVDTNDNVAFDRIINTPKRMIGESSVAIIKELANKKNVTYFQSLDYLDESELKPSVKNNALKFKALIETLRSKKEDKTPLEILKEIIEVTDYYNYLNESTKIFSVNEFVDFLEKYQNEYENDFGTILTIDDFIQNLALESDIQTGTNQKEKNALKLMTIHSAKGLEFKNVFIINMNENILPSARAISSTNSNKKIAEERRIAYVAYTRAKENLWLCSNEDYDNRSRNESMPSRFLYEIGKEVLDIQNKANNIIHRNDFLTDEDGWYNSKKDSSNLNAWNSTTEIKHNYFVGEIIYHKVYGEGIVRSIGDSTIKVTFKDKKSGSKELLKDHKLISYVKE